MAQLNEEKFDSYISNLLKNNLHLIALAGIFLLALYIRLLSLPLVQKYLPDIDTYLFYRMSDYLLNNNFHMMAWDTLRNYPFGLSVATEQPLPLYLPAIFYKLAGIFSSASYFSLVKYYAPIISSLTAIPMYLIGKELKDKWTGIFSAFFFAVMPAILMRNPAGYIEKEPATLVFMMLSVYFFIRTLRKDSWLSAALMGISLTFVDIGWGGVEHLYLAYAIFAFCILFVNRYSGALAKNYVFIVLAIIAGAEITNGSLFEPDHLMIYLTFSLIIARIAVERFNLVGSESIKYFVPALSAVGIIFVLVASTFSIFFANLLNQANGLLFYDEGVFGGTVAENQRPDLGSFLAQFGTPYAAGVLPSLQPILMYLSAWIFAFIALAYLAYGHEGKYKWAHVSAVSVAVLSFLMFLNKPGSNLQMIYIAAMFASLLMFSRIGASPLLLATFLFAAMLGFMSKVRVGFLMGPYIAIFAAYFMSLAIERIRNMDAVKNAATLEDKINVYSVGAGLLVSLVLVANLSAGYAIGSGMGPNYNDNWNAAMNFMKYNTSENSVMLSWWDFGYWFQTTSGRATMLDGGNNDLNGDRLTGLYFSSRMNETEQKEFLQSRGITHIIVDYSMIGKYPAMTRIGTDMNEIDSYIQLGQPQQIQKNGNLVLVFQLGSSAFYVPITQNGSIGGNVVFSTPQGDANLKYLCTEEGLIDLKPQEPVMDGCLLISRTYGVFFPVDATRGKPSTLTGTSVFTKLFFFDGRGVDYVKKVYDNPEVKIYEVELPRKTREELINWWWGDLSNSDKRSGGAGRVELKRRLDLKEICVRGDSIGPC